VQSIRRKESEGELPQPDKDSRGHRLGYSLQEINLMRDAFGTRPGREPDDEPAIISFSTFKGGAGKSTLSVHCAQFLALKGYKVLAIDCDPQGSMSTSFGANRDMTKAFVEAGLMSASAAPAHGIEDYLSGDVQSFAECIVPSYFPGIDIAPSGLELFNTEYSMAREFWNDPGVLTYVKQGVEEVYADYDVVIFDPPPALGFLSLSVLTAANAIVIPMRPALYDFASTKTFLSMLRTQLNNLIKLGFPIQYYFEKIAINHMDENISGHNDIAGSMRAVFSVDDFFSSTMLDSAEIDNAAKELKTVYDLEKPMAGHRTHQRCKTSLDNLFTSVEESINRIWDTHRIKMRAANLGEKGSA